MSGAPTMRAALLSIGDELTLGQNIDTNSPWIAAQLAERSIITVEQRTVADDRAAIATAVAELSLRADLLIITGGLGPTEDDLTREALGDVLTPGQALILDDEVLRQITALFRTRGRDMPQMNCKQAMRPCTMKAIRNFNGTAPGLIGRLGVCQIVSLPGPPREMQPMFIEQALPHLALPPVKDVVLAGSVHQLGMGESDAAQRLGVMMHRSRNPLVGITVSDAIVSARVRATGVYDRATRELEETLAEIEQRWQPYSFGRDITTLAQSTGALLRRAGRTLATAESCTGGWLGKLVVDVPGSSDYHRGGWVPYSNAMKSSQLKVPASFIERCGAVSEPVARAMAESALAQSGADDALAITGIAGPPRDDLPSEKPLGTVFIALARKRGGSAYTLVRHFIFPGDRLTVRDRAAKAALQMLRFALLDQPDDVPLLWEFVALDPNPPAIRSHART
jgi:nicotinamide-nucleotide amidase